MSFVIAQKRFQIDSKVITALLFFMAVFVALTMMQDAIEAHFHRSAFYLSESFLFSSFWWLFVPLLYGQYIAVRKLSFNSFSSALLLIAAPVVLHLFAFPILVRVLSGLFYYHTFSIQQTLEYTLSVHLYQLVVFYTLPFLLYRKYRNHQTIKTSEPAQNAVPEKAALTAIVVAGANKHTLVAVGDILYITASSPYIILHTGTKKHLHHETMASVLKRLDDRMFVRIHKSTIVNIHEVKSYTSRLNGDYDVAMQDGSTLRLSRNYVAAFKALFGRR